METCKRCGTPIFEDAGPESPLDFLEAVVSCGEREPEGPLCERCGEERRMTGAALLDDLLSG
ncbi:hypothetical protein [Deferrisoma camini]|uniref:hypothetical protein n=1 Tax=Deferrisoma camini TaxID=1035120 RepID=UPI00046CF006|nr:hypothetical protein [Deferrisoma camini]